MANNCYFCNSTNNLIALKLKDSFTSQRLARNPQSQVICSECDYAINLRAIYHKPDSDPPKISVLFSRNWSWLRKDGVTVFPKIAPTPIDGEDFPRVTELPTRSLILSWLLDPPKPPFEIVIATSGQKHLFPFRLTAYDQNLYPVLFEENKVIVDRALLRLQCDLITRAKHLGAGITEIISGDYQTSKFVKAPELLDVEQQLQIYRGDLLFELSCYLA